MQYVVLLVHRDVVVVPGAPNGHTGAVDWVLETLSEALAVVSLVKLAAGGGLRAGERPRRTCAWESWTESALRGRRLCEDPWNAPVERLGPVRPQHRPATAVRCRRKRCPPPPPPARALAGG